jgi:hypothetical protein
MLESRLQLETTAAHVPFDTLDFHMSIPGNLKTRLLGLVAAYGDPSRHYRPLGLLSRCAKTPDNQKLINARFVSHCPIVKNPVHLGNPV